MIEFHSFEKGVFIDFSVQGHFCCTQMDLEKCAYDHATCVFTYAH